MDDNAGVLGSLASQLDTELQGVPVWFESFVNTPPGGIKTYADQRIGALTSHENGATISGFIIVMTTNPREWRISMSPEKIASGEQVRLVGVDMVAYFKNRDFHGGILRASRDLVAILNAPAPAPQPVQQVAAQVEEPRQTQVFQPQPRKQSNKGGTDVLAVLAVVIVLGVVIGGVLVLVVRARRKQREEEERRDTARRAAVRKDIEERERRRREASQRVPDTTPPAPTALPYPKMPKNTMPKSYDAGRQSAVGATMTTAQRERASRLWNSRSEEERERIALKYRSDPLYDPCVINDPFQFYMFLYNVGCIDAYLPGPMGFRSSGISDAPAYVPPPRAPDPEPERRSYSPPARNDDDDSWRRSSAPDPSPSPSFDSPSSPDISSSSDSSGGGGSW